MTVTELSTDSQQMLDIVDQYERGDLNMDEAIVKISDLAPIGTAGSKSYCLVLRGKMF